MEFVEKALIGALLHDSTLRDDLPLAEAHGELKSLTPGPESQLRCGVDDLRTRLLEQRRHGGDPCQRHAGRLPRQGQN